MGNSPGLLSVHELMNFTGFHRKPVRLTPAACQRLFDQLITYAGTPHELDYRGFVQLVLALDDIQRPTTDSPGNASIDKSLKFFWKVLDYDMTGCLSHAKIQYFYRDITAMMLSIHRTSLPSVDIVVQEIYDMLGFMPSSMSPSEGPDWEFIQKNDQAKTVIMMLLDVEAFYRYEYRESLAGSDEQEEDEQGLHSMDTVATHEPLPDPTAPVNNFKNSSKFNLSDLKFDDDDDSDEDYEF
jgi:hypothetical protein